MVVMAEPNVTTLMMAVIMAVMMMVVVAVVIPTESVHPTPIEVSSKGSTRSPW